MSIYTQIEVNNQTYIRRDNDDGSSTFIRIDYANSDYQAYLEYLAENPVEDVE
jgi:hypothetical protein